MGKIGTDTEGVCPILPIIAHLKNNHFVVVMNIAADEKVTYVEYNRGQNGYTWTVSRQDFENSWTGYAIVLSSEGGTDPSSSLRGDIEGSSSSFRGDIEGSSSSLRGANEVSDEAISIIKNKQISDSEAQRIKGSCLPFLFPLLGMIFGAIASAATVVVGAISAIVTGISAILAPIITGIGQLITGIAGFMTQVGGALFSAVQFVGTSLLPAIGGWVGGIGSFLGNAFGLGGILTSTGFNLTGLGVALGKTIVTTALSIGISKGLESLGVNSTISGLLSSFVTGGVSGLFNSGFSLLSFVTGGVQGLAIQGVNQLGSRLGIDPILSNVIGMTAGSLIGAGLNGVEVPMFDTETGLQIGTYLATGTDAIGYALNTTIKNTVAGELSFYGITKAGELLGVDPRISYATSAFASSLIGNTVSGADIATSFSRAINSSIVSVGVNLLEGVDPAFSAIRSTDLMGALENILNEQGLFNGVFGILDKIVPSAFNAAGEIVGGIFNGAKTFVELVTESGPLAAMNSALNSLFTRQTVEAVVAQGGMEAVLTKPSNQVVLPDGRPAQEIAITNDSSIFLNEAGEIISIKEKGITATGSFVWTQNNGVQLKEGTVSGNMETGYNISADIENGKAKDIKTWSINGEAIEIDPEKPNTPIEINSVSNSPSEFNFIITNAILCLANTFIYKINQENVESIEQKISAIAGGSLFDTANKFLYELANGICNTEIDKTKPPFGIRNLMDDLNLHSNYNISKEEDMLPIPLYQGMTPIVPIDGFFDAIKWLIESQSIYKSDLVTTVRNDMTAYFITHPTEWNRPIVAMGYSGGFMPLVEAVSSTSNLMYNVKTLVALGGPTAYLPGIIPATLIQLATAVATNNLSGAMLILASMGIGLAMTNMDQVKDFVVTKVRELVAQSNISGEDPPFILSPKTDLIVNVWGTKDIFHELGVVDKRDNFLGKTTYNIEIVGAEHGDYIRRDLNDKSDPPDIWNNTVASFVTDLVLYSKDENQLRQFFDRNADKISLDTAKGVYVVRLPGSGV